MLHLGVEFPTEQCGTNAAEKTLLRDLGKYQKDQSFKYLNESTVPFISVRAGEEGAHTPDEDLTLNLKLGRVTLSNDSQL